MDKISKFLPKMFRLQQALAFGGTATYSCSVFDKINNKLTQMQAAVEACTSVTTIFPFDFFFLNSPQNTQ